ncbi:putative K(+)-stimulated pyrophosphate-energized sodium pump [Caprobacter fermentans]|uniref:Putative K(+)-stimulated pyrophosphate-energized sodium pump n=1 Tax=Caproicibacter fermentans TaxID=2576756 RepID=A0A6N8I4A8_9FIRM|nr:sodium-translocating pyrophosphatase [Caproicibacter fermentans]MVB12785.1 putative K(+)-stimulated pyrophosphate-energized sodium pump [Caproicibacter fermentans]OCN01554.1 sodium-translocating pyrophosphatase [Clostridium sp. W14A]QNK40312.1 sodium-translocating pyrophosphatase [Caproicibacter fermentans]
MEATIFAPIGAVVALLFAWYLAAKVLKADEGSDKMKKISLAVRRGANAYLKRQYTGVAIFFGVMFIVLLIMAFTGFLTIFVPFAFLTGGFFSGLSGFIGMKIATNANDRTANAAQHSLNSGLHVAFSAGAVMGFVVVGLGLVDISFWYYFLKFWYSDPAHLAAAAGQALEDAQVQAITTAMLTFGMGASSMALFARVGGGIFTKAADVGADLVGKVEAGIPEDDPRNPAVIADNVGDNVGDVAGMGADLYESYVGSIISTAALASAAGLGFSGVSIPMVMAAVGIIASIVGTFFVRTKEGATQKNLLTALRRGTWISALLIAIVSYPLIRFGLGADKTGLYFAILSGLLAGILIGISTEYFTSDTYRPTRDLAADSSGGPATVIIGGLALGMKSTVFPVVIVGVSVLASYFVSGGAADFNHGLYGIGLSAVGMLSTLGITLATDAYGPVADNAGGIAEMSELGEEVRERTDALDSLGNTTAATGKGFAIGSAALTALALIASYMDSVKVRDPSFQFDLGITNPIVLVGLFIGGVLPFLFSAFTMNAVGRAAQSIVNEVRRQFHEITGLMEGKAEPDYETCVDICTRSAQKEMVAPALVGIATPIIVGLILGVNGVVGMLAGATVTGFVMAVMMANAGGAWDNAKKYIESGKLGGKGSSAHKAAVVGDTVGDPFKDTSGPSLNILIKLTSMVSIVFAGLILSHSIF